ncbi:MAG: RagB/SusD family nutrient uptake outer membrane protein [Bacteroides sp.]|nr:RagB/SusD family nutrient uptake outer membrane protein [Bacteroides sp.]MCM1380173.1 RagB/SusD family nutrient uptake outer membrane protein [Bacteroides sp.]MCM1446478.1 RagB/SusD family nutrient uptake outer membrane protein [Prevotella sp.]
MKLKNIFKFAVLAASVATMTGVTSCNYLDVVPPEQPGLPDGMKNHDNAKGFLYSCYNKMFQRDYMPRDYRSTINASTDEYLITETWYANEGNPAYNILRNTQTTTAPSGYNPNFWDTFYAGIGQTLLFDQQLDTTGKENDVNQGNNEEYREWKAESRFCRAFYHFQLLRLYGPIPITTELIDREAGLSDYPGRTHFDGCVDWIAHELDEAYKDLPQRRESQDLGRATKVICKAIKARLLLYAASDLWNGKFPPAYNGWNNGSYTSTNPITGKDYGNELVYRDPKANSPEFTGRQEKWLNALIACKEALNEALAAGYKLYDPKWKGREDFLYPEEQFQLYWVPNQSELESKMQDSGILFADTNQDGYDPESQEIGSDGIPTGTSDIFKMSEFLRAIWKLRQLSSTTESEGNTELIWTQNDQVYGWRDARLPRNCYLFQKNNSEEKREGWNGVAPTLYTVEHFLNADGSLPSGANGPANLYIGNESFHKVPSPTVDNGDQDRAEVTNICLNREPRFYAWIGFNGGDYLTLINNGAPKRLNMRSSLEQGRMLSERNYSATGFLSMKHIDPYFHWDKDGNVISGKDSPEVFVRLTELYLNLAECCAEYAKRFGKSDGTRSTAAPAGYTTKYASLEEEAFSLINKIRARAYVGPLTKNMIGMEEIRTSDGVHKTWDLVEWVRNERFIELWDEGHRYFDVRRWAAGDEYFGYGKRRALNALAQDPKNVQEFNRTMMANSQYTFHYREYLYPIYVDEVYKNPQMVQNPGF